MGRLNKRFVTWLNSWDRRELAKKLGVSISTAQHWKKYRALPNAPVMAKIQKLSGTKITYADMIEEFLANRSKGVRR